MPILQLSWNLNYAGIARMWRGGCIIKVTHIPIMWEFSDFNYLYNSLSSSVISRRHMKRLRTLNRCCSMTFSTRVSDFISDRCVVKSLCSCSQGAAGLEACCRTGSPLGYSYSSVQHSSGILRRVQEWDRPCQHSSGTGMCSPAPRLLLSLTLSLAWLLRCPHFPCPSREGEREAQGWRGYP